MTATVTQVESLAPLSLFYIGCNLAIPSSHSWNLYSLSCSASYSRVDCTQSFASRSNSIGGVFYLRNLSLQTDFKGLEVDGGAAKAKGG